MRFAAACTPLMGREDRASRTAREIVTRHSEATAWRTDRGFLPIPPGSPLTSVDVIDTLRGSAI